MDSSLEATDIERALWAYDKASVSNISLAIRFSKRPDAGVLAAAVERTAVTHPYLGYGFSADGTRLVLREGPTSSWVPVPPASDWISVVEEELHTAIDLSVGPRLRNRWVLEDSGRATWVLSFPHVFLAGTGALQFVRDVLERADATLTGRSLEDPRPRPLTRPRSSDFDPRRGQSPAWTIEEPDEGVFLGAQPPSGQPAENRGPRSQRSLLVPLALTRDATAELLEMGKRLDLSWNALVSAAALVAARTSWNSSWGDRAIKVTTAIDLRELLSSLGLTSRDFGMWAGRYDLYARIGGSTGVEAVARALQRAQVPALRRSAFHGTLALVAGTPSAGWSGAHLKLTSLGDLDDQGFGEPWKELDVSSVQSLTALHRGWRDGLGWGVIPSLFRGRLQLALFGGDPGTTREAVAEWAGHWARALGFDPARDLEQI